MNKNLPWVLVNLTFLVMSDQEGLLVGHLSFQEKKKFAALSSLLLHDISGHDRPNSSRPQD